MPTDRDLFQVALDIADPAARAEYLSAHAPDAKQLARVERLLAAHAAAGGFLEQPPEDMHLTRSAVDLAATRTASPDTAEHAEPSVEQAGEIIAGKYKLLQQIGVGGMGSVWMADQTEPVKRRVAVKLIRVDRGSSKTILSRFEAERQAIALMDHPHIAKLLDAGTTDTGQPYFVMELVKGVPLTDYCDAHKLSISDRLNLFMQICSAVQHAHQKGIIHRDLKPTNILVESHDDKPVPKVIDFGLAKATSGMQLTEQTLFTAFGTVMGTPLYMAPEQAKFNAVDVDTRADVFALGVILYELLTGTTPIARDSMKKAALDEMLRLIREQEAPTPSSRLSSADNSPNVAANRQMEPVKLGRFVKGELDWIVMKSLSKERDRRYETANGFAKDIERFLNHEPVLAGPPSASYRLRKFVRRNRPQVIAAVLVLVALLAGIAGTTWQAIRAESARAAEVDRAEGERLAKVEAEAKQIEAEKQRSIAQVEKENAVKATAAETAALEQTRRRLRQIEKGVDLLASLLTGINPRNERNEEMGGRTLYERLCERASKAADQLNAESVGDAQAVARLQTILGETLYELGDYPRAIAVLEKAVATRERELGDDHSDTLKSRNQLAIAYQATGKLDKAIPLFERNLKVAEAKLGDDHPVTLNTRNNLANAYLAAGKLDMAIPLFERTLKAQEAKLGDDHPSTLTTRSNLATAYQAARKLDLAIPLLERTLKAQEAKLGDDHPSTLTTRNNLATAYQAAEKLDLAIPLLERNLKAREAKLGDDHPDTLMSRNNMATAYHDAGKLDLAIPLYERTLKAREAKLGDDHPDTLMSRNNMATAYQAARKLDLAIPLFERNLKAREAKLGHDHPDTLMSRNNMATAYQAAGKLDLAIPLFERNLKAREAKQGHDHPDTLMSRNNMATAYQAAGKLDLAIPLFERTLKASEAKLGVDHPNTLTYRNELAVAYQDAGKKIPLFEYNLKASEAKLGYDHPTTLAYRNNLATAYKGAGKLDLAIPLFERNLKAREANLGHDHPDTLTYRNNLAKAYQDAGNLERAISLFEQTLNLRKVKSGLDHPDTLLSMNDLARAYLDAGKLDLAMHLFEMTLKLAKAKLGSEHPHTLLTMNNLAQSLLQAEVFAEAEPLLRECLAIREKQQPNIWTTFNTKSLLGGALLGQKKFADAEPLLLAGYMGMKEREKTIPASRKIRLPEAVDRLVELYTATNKPDEVKKWQAERAKYSALAPQPREKK